MARIEAKRVEIHILHAYLLLFGGGGGGRGCAL